MLVIVPNHVRDAINAEIDQFCKVQPVSDKEREQMYYVLLDVFDKHGKVAKLIPRIESTPEAATCRCGHMAANHAQNIAKCKVCECWNFDKAATNGTV